jgi:transposase
VNVLKPHLQTTIWTLLRANASQREIERVTGISRHTIRTYQQRFAAERANCPGVATGSEAVASQTAPPRPPAFAVAPRSAATSLCEPHREFIEAQLRLKRNATAIYQDLVDQHGFAGQYNSVKRFCAKLRHKEPEQFDRLSFLPGEEMQVDYGEGAPTRVPGSDRYRKPRLFVATLRYSRASFRCVVWKSSQQVWAELHERAFRYFGGCPQYVVLDNLKEGVIKPDLYEPELNPVYAATLAHYGVVADPARVRDPNRKGTVEHAIGHTQATALKGRRFESIEAQNEFLAHWEKNWAAKRIHGTERRQVQAMFEEERSTSNPCRCWACSISTRRSAPSATTAACGWITAATPRDRRASAPRCWCASTPSASRSGSGTLRRLAAHPRQGPAPWHGGAAHGRAGVQSFSGDPPDPASGRRDRGTRQPAV